MAAGSVARDGWHAVGLARSLEPETVTGTRLFGREIAVWRGKDGGVRAFEDRCPHRGMRFTFGFVRGDRLACLYHGWQFDGEGRCRYIPAHPTLDVPASIVTPAYETLEVGGLIFCTIDGPDCAPPRLGALDGLEVAGVRSLHADCTAERLADAFLAADFGEASGGAAATREGGLVVHRLASGSVVVGAVQALGEGRAALHVVAGGPSRPEAALLLALAAALETVRAAAEAGGDRQ